MPPAQPNHSLLLELQGKLSADLFASAAPLRLTADEALFLAGDGGDGCYLVEEGLLKVAVASQSGGERILAFLGPGAIAGEMSLVGPRPHPVALNRTFEQQISPFSRRHNVKPGITGWAQVNGYRGETDTLEKMQRRFEHDIYYIDNWSFVLDVKILLMTLFSKSAYKNAF